MSANKYDEFDLKPDSEDEVVNNRPDYEKEILDIIHSNASPKLMREELEDYHANDIAEVMLKLSAPERQKLYRILDVNMLSEILEYTEEEDAIRFLDEMDIKRAVVILSNVEVDFAVDVLRSIEKEKRKLMIEMMDEDVRKDIALVASFDEDEIGSKMTTNYIEIHEELTVKGAMSALVKQAADNDNISTLFVVDEIGALVGAIDLKELIIARTDQPLDDVIMTSYPYVYGNEKIDDCIEKLKDYSENSIPVLDNNNILLGVITSQSVIEVVDEAFGEDYAKLAGLTAEEDLNETIIESMRKRLPWLIVLLGLGLVVSSVVSIFEQVVSQLPLIMAFQSLILDMAGNVGTQSLAVTIRVLMDENLTTMQKIGLVFKETKVGFCNGLLLGVVSLVFVGLYIYFFKAKPVMFAFAVSACIGVSLLAAMTVSSTVGTLIPLVFHKMGVDPAVASGPLITTVNDLVAVVIYYGLSGFMLINVLKFV